MQPDTLSAPRWHQLSELIASRTGLCFPPERRADLQRAVNEAARDFGCHDGDACADWLLQAPLSPETVRKLAPHLTIGETYFFRERPSFDALATQVLPQLIARRRDERRLRLWSAACSTGEEAYSLAMLVQQVLPDWRDWDVRILATDLNAHALRKAEAGIYGDWSFRGSGPDLSRRFFSPAGDRHHRVNPELRAMIKFAELNLAQDAFPAAANGTQAMDLILCRNLLIYFTPAHARRLVGNLRQSLVDDGWLVVSPSECSQALFTGFTAVNFPGSILYRKRGAEEIATAHLPVFVAPSPDLTEGEVATLLAAPTSAGVTDDDARPGDTPEPELSAADRYAVAETAYAQGEYAEVVRLLETRSAIVSAADTLRAQGLLTRALANQGSLPAALDASERWLALDKLDPAAHYLHAMVLQELGERARARAALQRAVYLQPEFALAHFALGNQARAEARAAEARRHFDNAARLLAARPADERVAESEGLTAGQLREMVLALEAEI